LNLPEEDEPVNFEENSGVIVIGATNFPEALDSALIRPGRFDKIVHVNIPDKKGRKEIIDHYLSKVNCAKDVDSETLAKITPGLTGADLANIINFAAIKAVMQKATHITMKMLYDAQDDAAIGVARKSAVIPEENRKLTAYHEGGHALVSLHVDGSHPIHKATIMPRGPALGMVVHRPEEDQTSSSKKQMLAQIAICMGGRAAEEIRFGFKNITSGASSDFEKATMIANAMVTKWGMSSKVGKVYHKDLKNMSSETKNLIDSEVQLILDQQFQLARSILEQHRDELELVANALLENETLTGEELKDLLKRKTTKK